MRATVATIQRARSTAARLAGLLTVRRGRRSRCLVFTGAALVLMMAWPGHRGVAWAEVRDPYGVAVIIGNANYERASKVQYAHRDAAAFRRYVVEVLGYDPKHIIEVKDAKHETMEDIFGNNSSADGKLWSLLNPNVGSDVVVFYSGHGVPSLKDNRSFLAPVDVNPDDPQMHGYSLGLLP